MKCSGENVGQSVTGPVPVSLCTPHHRNQVLGHLPDVLGCVEVVVSLFNFVNVELHSQGWYALRVRPVANSAIKAVWPCPIMQSELFGMDTNKRSQNMYSKAHIEEGSTFRTNIFRIKYCYEEVLLGQTFSFQMYFSSLQNLLEHAAMVEVDLMFMDSDPHDQNAVPDAFHLKAVATEQIRISSVAAGGSDYYACTFDCNHVALCNISLHSSLLGFTTLEALHAAVEEWEGPPLLLGRSRWSWKTKGVRVHRLTCGGGGAAGGDVDRDHHADAEERSSRGSRLLKMLPKYSQSGTISENVPPKRHSHNGTPPSAPMTGTTSTTTSGSALATASSAACPLVDSPHTRGGLNPSSTNLTKPKDTFSGPEDSSQAHCYGAKPHESAALLVADGSGHASGHVNGSARHGQGSVNLSQQHRNTSGLVPTLDDAMAQKSLGAALFKALMQLTPGDHSVATLAQSSSPEQLKLIHALYDCLVGFQKRGLSTITHFLKGTPKSCFSPQNYETLHVLLLGDSARATAGTCADVSMFPNVDGTNWPEVPDANIFMKRLPQDCTAAEALLLVEQALRRLRQMMWAEHQVLMWVLRVSNRELHRYLKCHWELEQPRLVEPWVIVNSAVVDVATELMQANAARHALRKSIPTELPRAMHQYFWSNPGDHPILYVDTSLMVLPRNQDKQHSRRGETAPGGIKDSSSPKSQSKPDSDGMHVMVFVHGFAGSSTDLSLIKAQINMMYPTIDCLSSKSNENNTHDSLQEMGQRLATEVAEHLAPLLRSRRHKLARLSFVGHSIGNMILRAALGMKEMEPYIPYLHLYLSISGPHLGFLYLGNSMVETGISVLKTIGRGKCLHQLSFTDAPNIRDCFVYKLAHQQPGLSAFKHVMLVSSLKDRYVPFHSSRISSACPAANKDNKRRDAYKEMVAALTKGMGRERLHPPSITVTPRASLTATPPTTPNGSENSAQLGGDGGLSPPTSLIRVDVDFDLKSKSFSISKLINNKIGRQAHIEFIENFELARFLVWGIIRRYKLVQQTHPEHTWV